MFIAVIFALTIFRKKVIKPLLRCSDMSGRILEFRLRVLMYKLMAVIYESAI